MGWIRERVEALNKQAEKFRSIAAVPDSPVGYSESDAEHQPGGHQAIATINAMPRAEITDDGSVICHFPTATAIRSEGTVKIVPGRIFEAPTEILFDGLEQIAPELVELARTALELSRQQSKGVPLVKLRPQRDQ